MDVNTSSLYLPTSLPPSWQASPGSCLVLVVPHCVTGPHCPTVGCRNASPGGVPGARTRAGQGSMRRSARPPSGSPTPPNPSLQRTGRSRFWDSFSHSVSFRLFGFVARRPAAELHIVRPTIETPRHKDRQSGASVFPGREPQEIPGIHAGLLPPPCQGSAGIWQGSRVARCGRTRATHLLAQTPYPARFPPRACRPQPATWGARDTSPFLKAEPTLRSTATANAFGPGLPGLAPPLRAATPARTGGRPNPSLQRTRYARR